MRGRGDPRAALTALALGLLVTTGAVAAAPVSVIRATDGARECAAALGDGATFHYRYIQSMYEKPVVEDLVARGRDIAVLRIHSTELRAVEYYRWDTPIRKEGDTFVQESPGYATPRLAIRVSPPYAQRIDGDGWSCDLQALFPGELVTVSLETRAIATLR